ncbi:MAG: malonyl-CoA synthase [Hyphomicrobiales bacterium]|nr:malonyl-CoA synthase [Hyphomicrobiales bacterium]
MSNHLFDQLLPQGLDESRVFITAGQGRDLTFGALEARSAQMAHALVAAGVGPGAVVAAQVEKSPQAVLLMLACLRSGAVFLPLNTAYTAPEIAYFLGDARPQVFVCDPARLDELKPAATGAGVAHCWTLDAAGEGSLTQHAARHSPVFANVGRGPDDLAALLYTSGTTGRSKGAMLTHANLASNAAALCGLWRFTRDDVLIHALPIYHTHGLFVAINVALLAQARLLFLPRFDVNEVLALMPGATSLMGVPTFYTRLIAHPGLDRAVSARMRLFISGSAPLLAETHREFSAKTGHAILERYGMTETGMITSNPYDGERRPGTVGFPLPDVTIRITEPATGALLAPGEIGVVEVRGPNVFCGYLNMPEKTHEEFRADGYFITGDLGFIDAQDYLHIIGRGKDLVISGGFNVYPKEVESEIDLLDGVLESAVIGLAHPDLGEGVTAIVVGKPGAALKPEAMLAALKARLAAYKCPKRIILVDDLPRNSMGKVQKNLLRQTYAGLYSA